MVIRRLRPADTSALVDHLLNLSMEDRRLRFCGVVSDEFIRRHCGRIVWAHTIMLGCFVDDDLRGVAEMAPVPDMTGTAEIALTIDQDHQSQGTGSELLRRMIVLARNRFTHTLVMTCLPENMKMRRVAQKNGAQLAIRGGEAEGHIKAPWPSYLTLAEESMTEGFDIVRSALTAATQPLPARHH